MPIHLISHSALLWVALLVCAPLSGQTWSSNHIPGEFLLKLRPESTPASALADLPSKGGTLTLLRSDQISSYSNIWRIQIDCLQEEETSTLRLIRQAPDVLIAQFNHLISERNTPDDPQFANQWHHQQSGDHDIDTPEAWDITTGGFTPNGDRIVVAVLETNGSNYNHTDLHENHWVNSAEIEENGIDDDGNGYIDDFNGWNVTESSDNITGGSHGTAVSGMIGATGDNGTGGTGVNWDVDLMQIQLGSLNEASVIAGYSYALDMRMLYNETMGESGAFIVATNASWGINYADPEDFPLWCSLYDDLGAAGILSCAATANENVNVDVTGDMPTGCNSPYLISVTATNSNDIRTFAGYGTTSIDLAAPGSQVLLPTGSNAYVSTSGTSYASPAVAGVIALMYAAPCNGLASEALDNPQSVADFVRERLYEGVDSVEGLADEVATGGRLNARGALDALLANCASLTGLGCTDPAACNFNPAALTDDGSCTEFDDCGECGGTNSTCTGCTDPQACNYNETASIDDGTCLLSTPQNPCGCTTDWSGEAFLEAGETLDYELLLAGPLDSIFIELTFDGEPGAWASDVLISIEDPNGNCAEFGGYNMTLGCAESQDLPLNWSTTAAGIYNAAFAVETPLYGAGDWTLSVLNGWSASNGAQYDIEIILSGPCPLPAVVLGCNDPNACNFWSEATINDGTCDYEGCLELGCTYEEATNYTAEANLDDGSCIFISPCESPCPSDLTGDGVVTSADLLDLLSAFGSVCSN